MRRDRVIGALVLTGALVGGGVAGAVLGIPGISGAQSTTSEATTTTVAPNRDAKPHGGRHFGRGPGFSRAAEGAVVAKAIGISESELRDQLRGGKTIAEVAKAKGVDVQKVIDALVADASRRIDQAVTDKHITAERAASLKEGLKDHITHLVNEGGGFKGHEGPGFFSAAEGAVVAKAIGISESELRDQLRGGKTIAEVAKAKGVDVQKVIDALVADASRRIDQAVTDKHITAERAASLKAELKDHITHLVNEGGRFKGHFGRGPGFSRAAEGAVVAKAIGISESELRDQLRSGKTIAEVAKAKGVDVQKVIDALVADASRRIDQAVTDKHITAERAASLKAELKDHITHLVNEGGGFKGGHPFGERGRGFRRGFDGPPPGAVPSGGVPFGGVIS